VIGGRAVSIFHGSHHVSERAAGGGEGEWTRAASRSNSVSVAANSVSAGGESSADNGGAEIVASISAYVAVSKNLLSGIEGAEYNNRRRKYVKNLNNMA